MICILYDSHALLFAVCQHSSGSRVSFSTLSLYACVCLYKHFFIKLGGDITWEGISRCFTCRANQSKVNVRFDQNKNVLLGILTLLFGSCFGHLYACFCLSLLWIMFLSVWWHSYTYMHIQSSLKLNSTGFHDADLLHHRDQIFVSPPHSLQREAKVCCCIHVFVTGPWCQHSCTCGPNQSVNPVDPPVKNSSNTTSNYCVTFVLVTPLPILKPDLVRFVYTFCYLPVCLNETCCFLCSRSSTALDLPATLTYQHSLPRAVQPLDLTLP